MEMASHLKGPKSLVFNVTYLYAWYIFIKIVQPTNFYFKIGFNRKIRTQNLSTAIIPEKNLCKKNKKEEGTNQTN